VARKNNDAPLEFSCSCGQLQGQITAAAIAKGARAVCYCADCRAGELYLEQPDPAPGPVDLFQTAPDGITITIGAQNLAALRLSPRGPLRWYASCCNSPLCNTLGTPKLAFVAMQAARVTEPDRFGPVRIKGFVPQPDGKTKTQGMARMVVGLASLMFSAGLSGRWRQTPFFDADTGKPVAEPTLLSKEERRRLYP